MAGGTGGHLFPAMALAQELTRRGHEIHLMSDERISAYGEKFPAKKTHIVPSATPSKANPINFIKAGFVIVGGVFVAWQKLKEIKPDSVIAFGGYPIFPSFLAASLMGIPGILHEQNAVLGRANRALARFAKAMALSFEYTAFAERYDVKQIITGNPVRDRVREAAKGVGYSPIKQSGTIRLLIFGGSQGARIFSDLIPPAIALLPKNILKRLEITQQCRPEDLQRVAFAYKKAKVNVELAQFFPDLPERMVDAHLVISRSGASSIAELSALGCPAILIPLPGALDADQANNAALFEAVGGGWIAEQATISPQSLANQLEELFLEPSVLAKAAKKAKSIGQPKAVMKLADMAENIITRRK